MSPNETNEAWRRNMDMRLLDKAEPGHLMPIVSRGFCLHHRIGIMKVGMKKAKQLHNIPWRKIQNARYLE